MTHKHTTKVGTTTYTSSSVLDADIAAAIAAHVQAYHTPVPPPSYTLDTTAGDWAKFVPFNPPTDPGDRLDTDFGNFGLKQVAATMVGATIYCEKKVTPSGRPFAGASICTFGTFSQLYGTFEAKITYPAGQGVWPAFWLLAAGGKVTPPEIDVFESYPANGNGGSGIDTFVPALHTATNASRYQVGSKSGMTTGAHVWKIVWSATRLEYFLDGASVFVVTTDIPNVPMYPILTFGVGAPGFRADSTTPASMAMVVEYLRVWA